jgi:hypothetical protein
MHEGIMEINEKRHKDGRRIIREKKNIQKK